MAVQPERAREFFLDAVQIGSPEDRCDFLDRSCGEDAELRRRVEALIAAHERPESLLDKAAVAIKLPSVEWTATGGPPSIVECSGTVIGPYKLLQPIGEGGMGTVYMAEQTQPVRRTVALKLIKAGMDSRQVLARFGAERQALALMDHPNIAKVFDAGTTDTGRPYFVMELVKGIPITRFCDERRLTLRERLELAIPVCQAVQHAHQKGIIHRDLKPSNVLIALYDGKPVPKVIDFGVAKATGPRLTDQTLYTEFGSVVGTLEYMSPEQAELNQLDIDTRSDIYSLGVLLYELLTGSTPLDRKRLRQGALLEMLRVIREEESPRPSMRLSTTEELPSIAACRHIEPRKLSGLVRGELDWIVMKALEKDRNRRYESANGLAADLRRYLDDEPVQACPPSAWYRFGKFARRNRAALIAAGLIIMAMFVGLGMLAVSNLLITHQKNQKEAALLKARASEQEANTQRSRAERSLADAADVVDRMLTRVADEKLANVPQMEGLRKELLEDAVRFYQAFLEQNRNNKLLRFETAKAQRRLSQILFYLGHYQALRDFSRQAIAGLEGLLAEEPTRVDVRVELAEALGFRVGSVVFLDDRSEQAKREGGDCSRRLAALYERLSVEFPNEPEYRYSMVGAMNGLGNLIWKSGAERVTLGRQAVLLMERLAADYPDRSKYRDGLSDSHGYLGWSLQDAGKLEEALGEFQKSFKITDSAPGQTATKRAGRARSLNPDERVRAWFKICAARLLLDLGRPGEAEPMLRQAIALAGASVADFPTFGNNHWHLAEAKAVLGQLLADSGRTDEGIRMYRESLDSYERTIELEESRPTSCRALLMACKALSKLLETTGKLAQAEDVHRRSVGCADTLGRVSRERGYTDEFDKAVGWRYRNRWKLATALRQRGATAEADELVRAALALVHTEAHRPGISPDELFVVLRGVVWESTGPDELGVLVKSLSRESPGPPDSSRPRPAHSDVLRQEANLLRALASTCEEDKRYPQAIEALRDEERVRHELAISVPPTPEDRLLLARCYTGLAMSLEQAGRPQEFIAAFRQGAAIADRLMADFPTEPGYQKTLVLAQNNLAQNNLAWTLVRSADPELRDPATATELARKAVESAPKSGSFWNTLGVAHYRSGEWKAAIEALAKSMELLHDENESFNTFFLAMAHWKLGDKTQSRSWYDKADSWMVKYQPKNPELVGFRAEAAAVLGVNKTKH